MSSGVVTDVLLLSGGSRGIGAATVRAAAAQGYAIAFSYQSDQQAAEALADELRGSGVRVVVFQGEVSDPAFAARFFDAAEAALGPVTAVVNNAGITGRLAPFVEQAPDVLRRTLDVNVLGTMYLAQEALRRWIPRGTAGRMVNLSSTAATLGAPGEYVHYAASKAAIDAFTMGLAKEVAARGIRINAVAPATTDTQIHAAGGDADRPRRVAKFIPLGRIARPAEIADSVLWLLSPAASYVTGAVLRVGGGL